MVRLGCALGNYCIGAPGNRVGHEELELAGLVASRGQAGAIVTLDPEVGAVKRP